MKNIISISVISILILSGLSACKVKVAEAPKLGVEAPVALKTFAAQDLSFQDVKIFLWKKNTSPKDVETVLRSSKRMDKLAEDLAMINEAKVAIDKQFNDAGINADDMQITIDTLSAQGEEAKNSR